MALSVGNPHLVFFVGDVDAVPIEQLGPVIERDAAFPERINVNVAKVADGGIRLRTWERGAGLTLACGTGACAAAVLAERLAGAPSRPATYAVDVPGGRLEVTLRGDGHAVLTGPAKIVVRGTMIWSGP
ncbi:MAG: diaminopimelate epimerase [Actinomycetota bacterium]|nr:diaminopimelate epimerase [Actinomycetota bacterium]